MAGGRWRDVAPPAQRRARWPPAHSVRDAGAMRAREEDVAGGPSPEGPLGAHYEGWDDPVLRSSDYVEFTGDFQWYDHVQGDESHESFGVIGIDNRGGTSTLTGSAVFHIDNSDRPWIKHVAITTLYGYPYDGGPDHLGDVSIEVNPPPGYVVTPTFNQAAALATMYWIEHSFAFTVVPNPPWEEIVLTVTVDPGEELYFDYLHVATECIPEPAGLGVIGLAVLALRRRRR